MQIDREFPRVLAPFLRLRQRRQTILRAGIVDEHVERWELGRYLLRQRAAAIFGRHIGLQRVQCRAQLLGFIELRLPTATYDHVAASLGKSLRQTKANTARAAGDEDRIAG